MQKTLIYGKLHKLRASIIYKLVNDYDHGLLIYNYEAELKDIYDIDNILNDIINNSNKRRIFRCQKI